MVVAVGKKEMDEWFDGGPVVRDTFFDDGLQQDAWVVVGGVHGNSSFSFLLVNRHISLSSHKRPSPTPERGKQETEAEI